MKKLDQKNLIKAAVQNSKGQSVIEYLLLLIAVITVIIVFLSPTGAFKSQIEITVNAPADILDHMARTVVLPPP